ncbi:MAG: hypothetical protein WAM50_08550 [Pseudolabrys sp.]
MLDAPDRPLRPARDHQTAFQIEGHAVGVIGRVYQHRTSDAGNPLVDRVADDIDPKKALLPAIPDRAFAEIGAVRYLIEPQVGSGDPIQPWLSAVDVHPQS